MLLSSQRSSIRHFANVSTNVDDEIHSRFPSLFNTFSAEFIVFQIDVINVVPSLVTYLTKNSEQFKDFDLSCLKTILCGSAPIGRQQILDFFQKFPQIENFLVGYGMTEVVCLSHLTPLGESIDNHIGSCGKLLDGFEAMVFFFE